MTGRTDAHFGSSGEHLAAELWFVESVVKERILQSSSRGGRAPRFDEFAGTYISEEEIERYLEEGESRQPAESQPPGERVVALREEIDRRVVAAVEAGVELRLPQLVERFGLEPVEVGILLFSLAPAIELRFERLFGYLQNDVGKRRPTVQLLAGLLLDGVPRFVDARRYLSGSSRLFSRGLLRFRPGTADTLWPARETEVAESVADFVVGLDRLDPAIAGVAELVAPCESDWSCDYYRRHERVADALEACAGAEGGLPASYIGGRRGSGRNGLVEEVAQRVGLRVVRARVEGSAAGGDDGLDARGLLRDATLHRCLVQLTGLSPAIVADPNRAGRVSAALEALRSAPVIVTGECRPEELGPLGDHLPWRFHLPTPDLGERVQLWQSVAGFPNAGESGRGISGLAGAFRLTPGEIRSALGSAAALSPAETEAGRVVAIADVYERCRMESSHRLSAYAQRVEPRHRWDDIVLPADTRAQLREICQSIRERSRVQVEWGFGERLSTGGGLNILFGGPSGTGKTMSAELIGSEIGLDVFRVDISTLLSRWYGETEQRISRLFREFESSNCILFFDEADSVFSRRLELRGANERHSNMEVNLLLQKMEQHENVVVLATNLRKNLDPALVRRLNFVVEFPFPDEVARLQIWRKAFPDRAPLEADVDFEFLSRRFDLTGAHIKNIALNSANLAAADGQTVTMEQLVLATKRELQKLGRICSRSDFGRYYPMVRGADS